MAKVTKERLIGQKYGDLTITDYLGRDKRKCCKVLAECVCGSAKEYFLSNLVKIRHTTSCGCKKSEKCSKANRTHGISTRHPLHIIWNAMKGRCNNPKKTDFRNYGAKGVRVCELWENDFKAFFDWCMANGWKPGLNIDKDKIPKLLNIPALLYSPEMCSVITSRENQNNRSDNIIVEYNGVSLTLSELARKYNVKYHLLWERYVKRKWDLAKAVTTSSKSKINARI